MRFKQFLMEDSEVTFDGFLHTLNVMIERRLFLWRGIYFQDGKKLGNTFVEFESEEDGFSIADGYDVALYKFAGRTTDRQSVTGDNTILNILSKWKGFPNRKRSYFATQSKEHMAKFGDDFALIIPADHPNLFGYVPYDVNEPDPGTKAFKITEKIDTIGTYLNGALDSARLHYKEGNESSKVRNLLVEIAEKTNTLPVLEQEVMTRLNGKMFDMAVTFSDAFAARMHELHMVGGDIGWSTYKNFERLYREVANADSHTLQDFFNDIQPADFEASSHTIENLPIDASEESNDEIWFEGPYIAIKRYDLRNFDEEKLVKFLITLRDTVQKNHERSKKVEV